MLNHGRRRPEQSSESLRCLFIDDRTVNALRMAAASLTVTGTFRLHVHVVEQCRSRHNLRDSREFCRLSAQPSERPDQLASVLVYRQRLENAASFRGEVPEHFCCLSTDSSNPRPENVVGCVASSIRGHASKSDTRTHFPPLGAKSNDQCSRA